MRQIVGLDINGWHDFAVNDAKSEVEDGTQDEDNALTIIDGGVGAVVVALDSVPNFIGGPQAQLSPIGRGNGWGDIGRPERRTNVCSMMDALLAAEDTPERAAQWQATAQALTMQANQIVAVVPDRPDLDEARQEFLLKALQRRGVAVRLLWHPVATLLTALERNLIPKPHDGMQIACIDHSADGYTLQILTLRALKDHPGVFAPERAQTGRNITTDQSGFGLSALLHQAKTAVRKANPSAEHESHGPSHLPWEILLEDEPSTHNEIIRLNNSSWISLAVPQPALLQVPSLPSPIELAAASLVLLTTPLAKALREDLHIAVEKAAGDRAVILMPPSAPATGALLAGRRIERGIPHYLDRLEQISLVVLQGTEVILIDLVPANAVVAANREYISAPITGLGWPSGASNLTFYLRKGEEFRKWQTLDVPAPSSNQAVEVRLRQMPAQGRAAVFVTSNEWDVLRSHPVYLDWSTLEHDARSFEQIAEALKPKPIVPERVTGFAHIDRWLGNEGIAAFGPFISTFELKDAVKLREFLSTQIAIDVAGNGTAFTRAHLLDFDGQPPEALDQDLILALDRALSLVANECLSAIKNRRPFPNNHFLLAATWSFGRCPLQLQDEVLKAVEAYVEGRRHVLHEARSASTAIFHGLGRIIKDQKRLEQAIDLLLRQPPTKGNVAAALASLLSRPIATPELLTEERVAKTTKFVVALIVELRKNQKFGVMNYALQIVGGILRCRQQRPYALLVGSSPEADAIHQQLSQLKTLLESRANGSKQIIAKLLIIEKLQEMLSGSGGDSRILINLENMDEGGDGADGN